VSVAGVASTAIGHDPRLVQELSGREHHGTQSCYPGVLATLTPAERLRLGESVATFRTMARPARARIARLGPRKVTVWSPQAKPADPG
jgi:hypothetical protein